MQVVNPDWSKYVNPPPGAMQLREACKLFHDHYWKDDPLGPEPRGMGLKIHNILDHVVAYVMINPDTGKLFVTRHDARRLRPGFTFPIA
jgi:hypothetical protein